MIREKIASQGAHGLTNEELLSIVRLNGTKDRSVQDISSKLTEYLANTTKIPSVNELSRIHGIGKIKASQVLACLELTSRYLVGTSADEIKAPEDAIKHIAHLKYEQQEHFVIQTLNSVNQVIRTHKITTGLVNQTPAHAREVFVKAIEDRAVSIIVAHNHPSGNTDPSPDDICLTKSLLNAGKILGIPVIDHIIISKSGYTSICRQDPELFESYI